MIIVLCFETFHSAEQHLVLIREVYEAYVSKQVFKMRNVSDVIDIVFDRKIRKTYQTYLFALKHYIVSKCVLTIMFWLKCSRFSVLKLANN